MLLTSLLLGVGAPLLGKVMSKKHTYDLSFLLIAMAAEITAALQPGWNHSVKGWIVHLTVMLVGYVVMKAVLTRIVRAIAN